MTRQNCISLNLLMSGNLSSDLTWCLIQISLHMYEESFTNFVLVRNTAFPSLLQRCLVSPMATCLFAGGKCSFTKRVWYKLSIVVLNVFFCMPLTQGSPAVPVPADLIFQRQRLLQNFSIGWDNILHPNLGLFECIFELTFQGCAGYFVGLELQRCHRVLTLIKYHYSESAFNLSAMAFLLNANPGPRFFDIKKLKILMTSSRFFLKIAFHSSANFQVAGKASSPEFFLKCFRFSFFAKSRSRRPFEWRSKNVLGPHFMQEHISFALPWLCSRVVSLVFRVSDYKHHPEDVIGGALLGIRYLPLDILFFSSIHILYIRTTLLLPEKKSKSIVCFKLLVASCLLSLSIVKFQKILYLYS